MTLEEVSEQTGVSVGLLSQLQRGIGNPSFNTLLKIAEGLDVPISSFFEGAQHTSDPVVHKDQRKKLMLDGPNVVYELLTPDLNRALEFLWIELAPGESTERFSHEGEESGIVLQGTLEVHLGDEVYLLGEGDSISFRSTTPHWHANPGKERMICVWVATPASLYVQRP
jgi:quercetin dioxygenase-like cupin family protein